MSKLSTSNAKDTSDTKDTPNTTDTSNTSNVATFKFNGHEYDVGNIMRAALLKDNNVQFAGLQIDGTGILLLKVQCAASGVLPVQALVGSVTQVIQTLDELQAAFQRAVK